MARFHVVAIAVGLLLAVSGPSFAAKRVSDTKSAAKSQSRAAEYSGSAIPVQRSAGIAATRIRMAATTRMPPG